MMKNFIKKFIKEEKYLQNRPLETNRFIKYCNQCGLETDSEELLFLEKNQLLYPLMRIILPIVKENGKESYSSYGFGEHYHDLLMNWVNSGSLLHPSEKTFEEWESYKKEKIDGRSRIVSFYSNYQIYWLYILKKSCKYTINLCGDNIKVSSKTGSLPSAGFNLQELKSFIQELDKHSQSKAFGNVFDFDKKKEKLKEEHKEFNKIFKLFLTIQSVYTPYGKYGSKTIRVKGNLKKWQEIKSNFNPKKELESLEWNIKEVVKWYSTFSKKTLYYLGVKRDDWIKLWKAISWSKKSKLQNDNRLGIEYLKWSIILKKYIEDYTNKEILGIDEISYIAWEDILKLNPSTLNMATKRYYRNIKNQNIPDKLNKKNFFDLLKSIDNEDDKNCIKQYYKKENKDLYKLNKIDEVDIRKLSNIFILNGFSDNKLFKYNELYYLSNRFGLDYQPRVVLFVEGKTEEIILPKIFKWYYTHPENIGIKIINVKGVSKYFDGMITLKDKNNKYKKKAISNFMNLISYNLSQWQIIPIFIGDNENNIKDMLNSGLSIEYNFHKYPLPNRWKKIWRKDLELDNFTNEEIARAISEVIEKNITSQDMKNVRQNNMGISKVDESVKAPGNKIKIAEKLFDNLFNSYKSDKNKDILERPIFKILEDIIDIANLNHQPVDRNIELYNKKQIEKWLIDG